MGLRNDLDLNKMYGQLDLLSLKASLTKGWCLLRHIGNVKISLLDQLLTASLNFLNERQSQVENQMSAEKTQNEAEATKAAAGSG